MSKKNTTLKKDSQCPAVVTPTANDHTTDETPLNEEQQAELVACEDVLQCGANSAFEVGGALTKIKVGKLYRTKCKSFDCYCKEYWEMGRVHANRQIEAHKCLTTLKQVPNGSLCLPATESQARCIADLDVKKQIEVAEKVKKVVGDKPATAKIFATVRQELFPAPEKPPKAKAASKITNPKPAPSIKPIQDLAMKLSVVVSGLNKNQSGVLVKLLSELQEELKVWEQWAAGNEAQEATE